MFSNFEEYVKNREDQESRESKGKSKFLLDEALSLNPYAELGLSDEIPKIISLEDSKPVPMDDSKIPQNCSLDVVQVPPAEPCLKGEFSHDFLSPDYVSPFTPYSQKDRILAAQQLAEYARFQHAVAPYDKAVFDQWVDSNVNYHEEIASSDEYKAADAIQKNIAFMYSEESIALAKAIRLQGGLEFKRGARGVRVNPYGLILFGDKIRRAFEAKVADGWILISLSGHLMTVKPEQFRVLKK